MPTRFTRIDSRISAIGALMVVLLVGCSPTTAPGGSTDSGSGILPTAVVSTEPQATVAEPSATVAASDTPPDALMAAEGGDEVLAHLGTYVWLDGGSDSPWLPGAPIAVGAGEPLTIGFVPTTELATWRARYVPSGASDPSGAVLLGEGVGDPAFPAPGAGSWTVEVFVEFAGGIGNASYFWRLDVS